MFNARLREGGRTQGGGGPEPPSPGPREAGGKYECFYSSTNLPLKPKSRSQADAVPGPVDGLLRKASLGDQSMASAPFTERPSAEVRCPSPPSPEGWLCAGTWPSRSGYHAWQMSI